jgi:hypothetical protein
MHQSVFLPLELSLLNLILFSNPFHAQTVLFNSVAIIIAAFTPAFPCSWCYTCLNPDMNKHLLQMNLWNGLIRTSLNHQLKKEIGSVL